MLLEHSEMCKYKTLKLKIEYSRIFKIELKIIYEIQILL